MRQVAELTAIYSPGRESFAVPNLRPFTRDKNEWYQQAEKGDSYYTLAKVFTCDEWRHHEATLEQTIRFKVDANCNAGSVGAVVLAIHATNLPEPAKRTIPVHVRINEIDIVAEARKFLGFR